MTFKELTNELLLQGWRAYFIGDKSFLTKDSTLNYLSKRYRLIIQAYEGKKIIFIKTLLTPPIKKEKQKAILWKKKNLQKNLGTFSKPKLSLPKTQP